MGGQVLADARRGKHAAIADQHHAAEPEAPPQLVDLGGHGGGVGGVAGAHLGGNRAARGVAQQVDEDLAAATLAVAGVAAAGQLAVLAGVPDGGQVVQREAAVLQVAAGQPVEGVVELLLGDGTQGEVAGAAGTDVQQGGQAELAGAAEQGGDMAAGARVEDADGGGAGGPTTVPPWSSRAMPSTSGWGSLERLAWVTLRILPWSQWEERSRTAGGELRLGTRSMYMGMIMAHGGKQCQAQTYWKLASIGTGAVRQPGPWRDHYMGMKIPWILPLA